MLLALALALLALYLRRTYAPQVALRRGWMDSKSCAPWAQMTAAIDIDMASVPPHTQPTHPPLRLHRWLGTGCRWFWVGRGLGGALPAPLPRSPPVPAPRNCPCRSPQRRQCS